MVKRIYHIVFMTVLIFSLFRITSAHAQKQEVRKIVKSSTKELTGTITGITANSISFVYNQDEQKGIEYEIMLPMDNAVKLEHKRSLKELNIGDMVAVVFEEKIIDVSGEGQRTERKTKQISFVRSAEKKPESPKPPEPGEGLPDDI